ncbi:uncharacterized protein LOC122567038 isoform X2 [Bombus pyrosoma]|uniref:uncharacterized protein LOC122567038 isoform X2 n=1 Tax=Bombus pyrosoma TaxID=396416 RepID=UPI001CB8AF11|nr:uncharacterized protein LOC122567038 isoform X2 [Bombus pyrosoma]
MMDKRICDLCPLDHFNRIGCMVTTCNWPLLNIVQQRTNQPYLRKIEPIKGVRFKQPANSPQRHGSWTNLMYRPIVQGGFRYRGVYKLLPLDLSPNSPVLSRPAPVPPTDFRGITVYCCR